MAAETTRAIAYIRSATPTDSHTDDKTKLSAQQICTYCSLNGITLVDVLIDDPGVGQRLSARPTLRDALSALASGRADVLIVPSLPTLSRSIVELAPWLAEHFGAGSPHALIAVQEHIDTRQPIGRLALGVLSGLSLFDRGGRHA
ncbi:MAG TPA: hypothetical protein DCQ33_15295 [Nitrospira sp.]|nr:hypothetical protein [Nitrospira sp.]